MKLPRNAQIWFPGYAQDRLRSLGRDPLRGSGRVWISICDHYEPLWANVEESVGVRRVQQWENEWPRVAERHRDSRGHPAQYSFFFPQEEYRKPFLDPLTRICQGGFGDVDIHIHHDNEGEENFLSRMTGFIEVLTQEHGLLRERHGRPVFGFIHGNWSLDNSHATGRMCGLNNEISLLRDLGCYADFTMPAAPNAPQGHVINQIYWATDDPREAKSHDRGEVIVAGQPSRGDLLMIVGPLGVRWRERLKPRLENGELAAQDMATPARVSLWFDLAPRLGRDVFVKLFAHGCQERHAKAFFDDGRLAEVFQLVQAEANRREWETRFVSAWEMFLAVEEAAGFPLDPHPAQPLPDFRTGSVSGATR